LAKLKYYKRKPSSSSSNLSSTNNSQLYIQVSKNNIKDIVKIKENFLNLSAKKIKKVYKVLNNQKKNNPKINIITKSLSRKQVIIPVSSQISERIMVKLNKHIANINRVLKDIKSNIIADFICADNINMVIITNKVTANLDLDIIKKYIKNINEVDISKIMSTRLSQSKSYLNILSISYYVKDTNLPITSDIIERVLQTTYIFNDIVLAFHPHIIKASPKSDIAVI